MICLTIFVAAPISAQRPRHLAASPDSARIETSDVARFWSVFDSTRTIELLQRLQSDYIDRGTPGLTDYFASRTTHALDLARDIYTRRAEYERVRGATLRVRDAEPAMRESFRRMASLYPGARFPDVYFIIGRFLAGGVTLPSGIVVAAELYDAPAKLPGIVAHELVHAQQPAPDNTETLLRRALREGGADFIGEMLSGININPAAQAYGRAHERELWREFRRVMNGTSYLPWMYTARSDGKPNDLGYFIGYRVAQAYYDHAPDKERAIRDIISLEEPAALLMRSGYHPQ